jgi:hypothetical protein
MRQCLPGGHDSSPVVRRVTGQDLDGPGVPPDGCGFWAGPAGFELADNTVAASL